MSYTIDNTNGYSLAGDFCNLDWEDAPTQSGYYWVRDSEGRKQIVEVDYRPGDIAVYVMGTGSPHYVKDFVKWMGIIPEPIE